MWLFLKPVLRAAIGILTFGVTLPVGVLLAAGLWVHLDKNSAVRQAVDRAVQELVTGAELEAERARNTALSEIIAEMKGQAAALETANKRFSDNLRTAQLDLENANDEIRELATRPVNNRCVVDSNVLNRLRNR